MELVEGVALSELDTSPWSDALRCVSELAEACRRAREESLTHGEQQFLALSEEKKKSALLASQSECLGAQLREEKRRLEELRRELAAERVSCAHMPSMVCCPFV